MPEPTQKGHGFGTAPVFLAAISTILGAVMFLRFGYGVAHVGLIGAIAVILIGHMITIPTALAVAEIATNLKVEGGGEYFIISRSFGTTIGAAIGVSLYLSQAVSVAFYMIAFAEAFRPYFPWIEEMIGMAVDARMISLPAVLIVCGLMVTKGADLGVGALWVVAALLGLSLVMFFAGTTPDARGLSDVDLTAAVASPDDFALVFAICFPAFTGMTAGVGLSGDLKDPRKSIPLGTLAATVVGLVVYMLIVLKLHLSASPEDLAADPLIMRKIALWEPIIPIGLAAATLSSTLGSILVAPRTLQALASDRVIPAFSGILSRGRGDANEPFNATVVTAVIAIVFVVAGDVDFVAQIISMFFMVTYGALNLVSFLEHFASSPSYRPSFRTKWYLSLAGAVMCAIMMFQMSVAYAVLSLAVMFLIYLGVRATHKEGRGLADLFQGAMFQLTRWLQIIMQKNSVAYQMQHWRPSFIALSRHTLDRRAPFELLKWISHQHGFGTFIHYQQGYLSPESVETSKKTMNRLINRAEASGAGIFVDTMVSPSFTTALAQSIQLPGVSGLENNSVLFEFPDDKPEELEDLVTGCRMAGNLKFNTCVLRSTDRHFGYRRRLHVWLTRHDRTNANLMILLGYILLGHPDWRNAEIGIHVTVPGEELTDELTSVNELIMDGRLPISPRNVLPIRSDPNISLESLVREHSADADLVVLGYNLDQLEHEGADLFTQLDIPNDVLYVNACKEIFIV